MTDVSSETLALLYNSCEYCIYPSEYEGFGIPILEAFSYGKPVATSNISSMPEVGGDAADYFNPHELKSIENSIIKMNNPDYRTSLEANINRQLEKFESSRLIATYEDMYKRL